MGVKGTYVVYVERTCTFAFPVEADDRRHALKEVETLRDEGRLYAAITKRGRAVGGYRYVIRRLKMDGTTGVER